MEKRLSCFFNCKLKFNIIIFMVTICCLLFNTSVLASTYQTESKAKGINKTTYAYFYNIMNGSKTVPRIYDTEYTPQGLCKMTYQGKIYILITAYKKDDYSAIHLLDNNHTFIKTVYIKNHKGHCGGITQIFSDTVAIATDDAILFIKIENLMNTRHGQKVSIFQTYDWKTELYGGIAFCTTYNEKLWIGNFKTTGTPYLYPCNVKWNQNMKKYDLEIDCENKIIIPHKVQGVDFVDRETIVFSTSYGRLNDSKIIVWGISRLTKKTYSIGEIICPPMSEELCISNGRIYMIFESGAKKYRGGAKVVEDRILTGDVNALVRGILCCPTGGGAKV